MPPGLRSAGLVSEAFLDVKYVAGEDPVSLVLRLEDGGNVRLREFGMEGPMRMC